jgi:hypothetical protein
VNKNKLDTAGTLLDYFKKKVKAAKDIDLVFNRNKIKYSVAEILNDFTPQDVKDMIDYYVRVYNNPNVSEFCYEYDSIFVEMKADAEDEIARRATAEETRRRVEEFRQQYGGH